MSYPTVVNLNCATLPAERSKRKFSGGARAAGNTHAMQTRTGSAEAAEQVLCSWMKSAKGLFSFRRRRSPGMLGVSRLGSTVEKRFRGRRIIAATNNHLETAVAEVSFRRGPSYPSLHPSPFRLCDRREDLPLLCDSILTELAARLDRARPQLRYEDLHALRNYPFPGNIRELWNILERSLLSTSSSCAWLQLDPLSKARLRGNSSPSRGPSRIVRPRSAANPRI